MATKNNNTLLYAGLGLAAFILLRCNTDGVSGIGARSELDPIAAHELYLYLRNTRDVYDRAYIPMAKSVAKKIKRGQFDEKKALKALEIVADYAARAYNCEFERERGFGVFNKATRQAAALEALPHFLEVAREYAE